MFRAALGANTPSIHTGSGSLGSFSFLLEKQEPRRLVTHCPQSSLSGRREHVPETKLSASVDHSYPFYR